MHISQTKSFNIPVSLALATLAHMINVYEICLNTTNYPIFDMQDFRYCMWTFILDCFGQLVSSPCYAVIYIHTRSGLCCDLIHTTRGGSAVIYIHTPRGLLEGLKWSTYILIRGSL